MIRLLAVLLPFLAAALPSLAQDHPLPFVRVEGNRFVDDDGNEVRFRGVSVSDPDRLEKAGQWNERLFDELRDWNVNVVRLPVHPSAWRERGARPYLRLVDQAVAWAGARGMYLIIDWHSIGNLRTEVYQADMYDTTKTETFRFWQTVSARYRDNPVVAFYELFNEPTTGGGRFGRMTWADHRAIMEEIVAIIYAHDTRVIPLVAGFNWAYDLTEPMTDPVRFEGVAYVTHPYPMKREQPWIEKWEADWGFAAERVPVIATELGFMSAGGRGAHVPVIADSTYGETIVEYFERKGISWVPWVFDPQWSPQLIADWDFTPTEQGRFFRRKMRELNPRD